MQVKVSYTLDINPEQWATTFGGDPNNHAEIADDVREYILNNLLQGGVFGSGEVDATIERS